MKIQTQDVNIQAAHGYGTASVLSLIFKSLRPKQWTKNLIIFAGLIFSQRILEGEFLIKTLSAFVVFCFLSGTVYLVNDLVDIEKDREHPKKKYRPLASGQLKVSTAVISTIVIFLLTIFAAFQLNVYFAAVALVYFMLTLSYSFKLKNIVIIDVIVIALGFTLRAIAGAVVINVAISPWLLVCTFLLALFLALTKRRHELILLDGKATAHRKILDEYQPQMLDQMISVVTSSIVMAYSLYTFTAGHTIYFMGTIPFVVYGIFRYQYLAHSTDIGGTPENALLKDAPMVINILLWVISCLLILYIFK